MTLRQFFDKHPWINQREVADACGINYNTFRGYVGGLKKVTADDLKIIQAAIKKMIRDVGEFKLTAK